MSNMVGRSILVVEDERLLAMDVGSILHAAGWRVSGPVTTSREALRLIRDQPPDCAIIDLNLGGEMVFPVADALDKARIPFVILSGHSRDVVPPPHRSRPFIPKPYQAESLLEAVDQLLVNARATDAGRIATTG